MFIPFLRPGMKQRDQHAVDARRQICSFVKIAPVERKAQVGILVSAAVLPCDHMFDVKRNQRQCVLMRSAILATIPGTLTDQSSCGGVNRHGDQPEVPEITARAFI